MTPEQQKELSRLKADQEAQKAEVDFFAQGFPFTEVKTCSANTLFGNGKWKKVINEHIGADEFAMLVEKDGNKPVDFPLAAIDIGEAAKWVSKNDKIAVVCEDGKYNGQYKVLDLERPFVFIMKGMHGTTTGTVINESRAEGARKGLTRSTEQISNLEGTRQPTDDTKQNAENAENAKTNNKRKPVNKWLVLIALLLLIVIIYNLSTKNQ